MISAVVHTFNEQRNIERCLSSLTWTDEIIIIDMGSTDKTVEISKSFTSKIYQHPYTGFVEPARNFGINKTKGNWIIIVDADEEIPKTLINYLKIEIEAPKADYYRLPRKNIIFGKWMKHSGWWPDYQIRFFKKGAVVWNDKLHGIPITRGIGADLDAVENFSMTHHNYQSVEQYLARLNRYTAISAKELFLSNQKFSPNLIFQKTTQEFVNRYFVWKGYKDGVHGLVLSLLQSILELITYIKLWELEKFQEKKVSLQETKMLFHEDYKMKEYWLINELLNQSPSFFHRIYLKLKRKLL